MNRSAQPLPSGARTKEGELSMPRKPISFWKWSDIYCDPWSCRTERPWALGEAAEVVPHALTDRFQRLEPGCPRMGVDADAFSGAMIDRDEHRRRALAGERRRQIGSPHRVHRLGDDGAVVVPRPTR